MTQSLLELPAWEKRYFHDRTMDTGGRVSVVYAGQYTEFQGTIIIIQQAETLCNSCFLTMRNMFINKELTYILVKISEFILLTLDSIIVLLYYSISTIYQYNS